MNGEPDARKGGGALSMLRGSLSAKLLLLTVLFVLVAEAFVLVPSISKRRLDWFQQRIEAAYLVGLALEAPEAEMIDEATVGQLFATANILAVTVTRDGARMQIFAPVIAASGAAPPMHYADLARRNLFSEIPDAWEALFSSGDDMIRVLGEPEYLPGGAVDIIVSERALRADLRQYAGNVLWVSLGISLITAVLLFGSLNQLIVRPVQRLSRNMTAFQAAPEDASAIVAPSARDDEIGVAERSLEGLERRIQEMLEQRRRLAALGAGISKISHDLRNILASAQLLSDRLAKSDDPRVQKLAPRLIQALDRAIALSRDTLSFGRMEPSALSRSRIDLHALAEEVLEDSAALEVAFRNDVPQNFSIHADRNQLYRALFNLVKNAVEAHAAGPPADIRREKRVAIRAERDGGAAVIFVEDNGPGVPQDAIAHLFEPFRGSSKPGGSGLGIAISHEIARAHGGSLALARNSADGATFRFSLPQPG